MKITIESTNKIVMVCGSDREVAARIWQGVTEDGIPVHCYVTRIVPEVPKSSPCIEALTARFKRELMRCADGRPAVEAIPLRMII